MNIEDSRLGKAAVVAVDGRLDAAGSTTFEAHCGKLLEKGDRTLVLDFSGLEYLSSAGLRSILALAKKVKPAGGRIIISGLQGTAKEIFDISGFTSMFPMAASLEDAASQVL